MGVDQFDNLSADMFEEFDLDMDDQGSNKGKGSETLKGVKELLKSTGSGAMKGVRAELKDRFPHASTLVDDTIATVDDFKKLQQDLASEISPAVNTMKQIALRSMPMVEKIMPKKWYDGIKKKLEESVIPEEQKRDMEAEFRNETINSSIRAIFEGQTEIQKQMIAKEDMERMTDRKIREDHFKASHEVMSKLGDNVSTITTFITGTYTGYLKKSLELKYQGLFVMRDIHKAVVAIAKINETHLKEIQKNTGIPDYMKAAELKQGGLAAARGSRLQSYSEYQNSFRSTVMQNISKNIMGSVKEFTRGVIPSLDMATSMMQMMGGGEKLTPLKLAAMGLGWGASLGARHLLGNKLDKYQGLKSLIEGKGRFLREKLISKGQNWADRHRGQGGLLGWIANVIPTFNKQAVKNSMLEGANEAVPFDNTTRQTIVEVIPRHLERIGNLTEALQQTLAPNAKLNQMTFNIHQRKLTTIEEARDDFIEREFGSKESRANKMDESMAKFRAILLANQGTKANTKKGQEHKEELARNEKNLKRFIINSATSHRFFDVDELEEFVKSGGADSSYINIVMEGIPEEERLDLATVLHNMYVDPKTGRVSGTMVDRISNTIADRMGDVNVQEMMARASEGFGQAQLFTDIATHKKGVSNEGLLNMLDPKINKKKTTYYNPETGNKYTEQELKDHGLDSANQSMADYTEDSLYKELQRIRVEEKKLRRNWERSGGKEGDFADRLSEKIGALGYGVTGGVNDKLTQATEWAKKKYQSVKSKMSESFEDSVFSDYYDKAKSKMDAQDKKKPSVRSIIRTGNTSYEIHAKDNQYRNYTERFESKMYHQPGELPKDDILEFCKKKGWKFDPKDPSLTYREELSDDIPEVHEQAPEPAYTVKEGATGTYTVNETERPKRSRKSRSAQQRETVRTAADVATEAVAFDEDSRTSLRRWIPDKLDRIIELLGGGKPGGAVYPTGYDPTGGGAGPLQSTMKPTYTQEGRRRISIDPNASIESNTERVELQMGSVTSTVTNAPQEEHRPMGFGAIMEERERTTASNVNSQADIADHKYYRDGKGRWHTESGKFISAANVPEEYKKLLEGSEKKTIKQKLKDVTGKLVETFQNKEELIKYFPESMQEQVGAIYDNSVKTGKSVGSFFNKLSSDLKLKGAQKKILDDLKRISTVIPNADQRKKYIGEVLSKVSSLTSMVTDGKKRKEALADIRKKMADDLEDIQKEIEEKGVVSTVKDRAKSGIRGLFRRLKLGWLKFRRSKVGRWIMAHIPDSVKKDVKEAFDKAKGDFKKGLEEAKKVINKHNKEAKPGETPIDPKILNATQMEGSGDEGEPTAQDLARDVLPAMTQQQTETESVEGSKESVAEKQSLFNRIGSIFSKKEKPAVQNTEQVGFFGRMKQFFHRKKDTVTTEGQLPVTTTVPSRAVEQPSTESVKATKRDDSGKAPEGDLEFEGDAESRFHSDFRLFAQRQISDNQQLLSAILGIPGGGKGKGILGSIIGAGGKIGGGLLGAYGRIMAAKIGMFGNIAKGVLSGGGRIIGGALKAAPAVGKVWKGLTYPFRKKGAKPLENPDGTPIDENAPKKPSLWKRIFGKKEDQAGRPEYYQDENGKWHGPDGKFVSAENVPEEYKASKQSLAGRIKDRVKSWFTKPSDPNAKKKSEEDDNVWNRKGFKGFFRTAWDGAKKAGSWVSSLFKKDEKEGESEVPKAGRKLGIDLILNKLNDIFTLLKEERDKRDQKEQAEAEAKKAAEQAEASMSAEEQQAANEKKLADRKKEMEEDAARKASTSNQPNNQTTSPTQGESNEGDGEGGWSDDIIDAGKSKALKFARNKVAAGGIKLLRKTKWGRKLLRSPVGKLARKGIGTLLQKGKVGGLNRVANVGKGILRVGGRGIGSVGSKVGGLTSKALPALTKAAPALSGVGSKSLSFAGKAAAPLALIGVAAGGVKGFTASKEEDQKYAEDLGKENVIWRSLKTAFNPIRQGRIIASTVRNTGGLVKDLFGAASSASKANVLTEKLDKSRIAKLKELGAPAEVIKQYESMFGKSDNESIRAKNELFRANATKKTADAKPESKKEPKETISKEGSNRSISIPDNVAKSLAATSETSAECKSEFVEYVNEYFPNASQKEKDKAVSTAMDAHWNSNITGVETKKSNGKDVYDALDRFAPEKQTFWEKVTSTKPTSDVKTASTIQDKKATASPNGVTEYLKSKQPDRSKDTAMQQAASGNEALLNATTSGNQSVVDKLAEMVGLLKQQIVVTADSKVAQEKASAEGASKALEAAMTYAKETAQNAVAAARPKPQRPPAIDVSKPVPA